MAAHKSRNSGIELLKIWAMLLIVSSHVVQTLGKLKIDDNLIFDLAAAGNGITNTILSSIYYNGQIGNTIFFVCSAWFLIDSEKADKKKILIMIMDVWMVSVLALAVTCIVRHESVGGLLTLKSILPTTYSNNWYVTCYILFYSIHPIINRVIYELNQRTHLRAVLVMSLLYILLNFVMGIFDGGGGFFASALIQWVVIYFVIAYMKIYLNELSSNMWLNIIMLIIGLIGNYGLIAITNYVGARIPFFGHSMLYWDKANSPFIILISVSLLNLARRSEWKNSVVNYISSMTLLIYVIHENIFVRLYLRSYLWQQIFDHFGYDHVFLWILIMTIVMFVTALLLSILYKLTIGKLTIRVRDRLYPIMCKFCCRIEKYLMQNKSV